MTSKLSDICSFVKEKVDVSLLSRTNYISTENMKPNKGGICEAAGMPTTAQTQSYNQGDVLVSNIRPYFKKIWKAKYDGGCSNDVLVFRANEGVSEDFLYYVLADDSFFNYAMGTSKGTKMPRGDKVAIMQYGVPSFELSIQRKIASLLQSMDERIEQNMKINENLEQQAQAIFKTEFINIPSTPIGWKYGNLLEIADYLNGLAMQKFRPQSNEVGVPVLKIKELRQGSCDSSSELCSPSIKPEYFVYNGNVVFSWSGSLLVDFWCGEKCGLNQHLFKVTSQNYDKWFYYLWTNYHLQKFIAIAADMATTMGHIKREELSKSDVLIPNEEDYIRIGSILQPLYDMIISNRIENRRLASIRDSLLPQLMSRELDISDIEI